MSAKVSYDAQLMHHQVPSIPVPPSHRFVAVLDEHNRPLVFSIGNDNKFYLIMSDDKGVNRLFNLGDLLGFKTKAQAFAVSQIPDGTILVAFAMSHDQDHDDGDLYVLGPISPAELRQVDNLKHYLQSTKDQEPHVIFEKIYLVRQSDDLNILSYVLILNMIRVP
jgi:hypothetical protein